YSQEKTRSFEQSVRITGTLANPNYFSWIIIQLTLVIILFEKNKVKLIIGFLAGIALVFLSGSRSFLILLPFILLTAKFIELEKNSLKIVADITKYILMIFVLFVGLYIF